MGPVVASIPVGLSWLWHDHADAGRSPTVQPVWLQGEGVKPPGELAKIRVVEGVAVTLPLDPYLSLKALASYSGLSVRKLREALTDPSHPLRSHPPRCPAQAARLAETVSSRRRTRSDG